MFVAVYGVALPLTPMPIALRTHVVGHFTKSLHTRQSAVTLPDFSHVMIVIFLNLSPV